MNLWPTFDENNIYSDSNYKVVIAPNELTSLKLKLYYKDSIVAVNIISGKYANGYFEIDREWSSHTMAGPLLYSITSKISCIGIDKNNNLVVLSAEKKVLMCLMMFPISLSKHQSENTYNRYKKL